MTDRLCMLLEKIPLLRNRFYQMKKRMFLYYPKDEEVVKKKALVLCLKIWAVLLSVSLYFLLTIRGGYEESFLAICIFYMAYRYILSRNMEKESRQLLTELEVFLGELRFQYRYTGRIEEALEECIDRSDGMMGSHGRIILDALDDDEQEEAYLPNTPVRFLTQLLILCKSNFIYGDCENEKKSVFLSNVGRLKENVETELLKRKKIEYLFSGLLVTCMLPIGFITVIEMWAISNMQELEVYYYGTYGMITTLLLCLLTVTAYEIIRHMQFDEPVIPLERKWLAYMVKIRCIDRFLSWQLNLSYKKTIEKHHILKACGIRENVKQFLFIQYMTGMIVILLLTAGVCQYRNISRKQILSEAQSSLSNLYQMSEEKKQELSVTAEKMITGKIETDMEALELEEYPQVIKDNLMAEIKKERKNWVDWDFPWYLWLIPPLGGVAGYQGRYAVLLLKRRYAGLKREEEIITFQTIILCLMYGEQMTGEEIVYWLEKVAGYFRESIEKVLYKLVYQNYEDTCEIKEEEKYVPMLMILEGILACDSLPVWESFFQMESDYHYTVQKYVQESNNYIRDKSAICKVLAFAPLYMTIGCKLIVPFVLEGLNQLASYADSMKQLM